MGRMDHRRAIMGRFAVATSFNSRCRHAPLGGGVSRSSLAASRKTRGISS
jgi:hypothetical protein